MDSYRLINKNYKNVYTWNEAKYVRKNRRKDNLKECGKWKMGVDLNRNYGYKWDFNPTHGGSNDPCESDYRGKEPFSEPETKAMKRFIEKNKEIVSCMNFHAWGDLWIYPYNYTSDKNNGPLRKKPRWFEVYKEFSTESPHLSKLRYNLNQYRTSQIR